MLPCAHILTLVAEPSYVAHHTCALKDQIAFHCCQGVDLLFCAVCNFLELEQQAVIPHRSDEPEIFPTR